MKVSTVAARVVFGDVSKLAMTMGANVLELSGRFSCWLARNSDRFVHTAEYRCCSRGGGERSVSGILLMAAIDPCDDKCIVQDWFLFVGKGGGR